MFVFFNHKRPVNTQRTTQCCNNTSQAHVHQTNMTPAVHVKQEVHDRAWSGHSYSTLEVNNTFVEAWVIAVALIGNGFNGLLILTK